MAWYWIVLIVLGYCFMVGLTTALWYKKCPDDGWTEGIAGAFWPISLPVLLGHIIIKK